MQARRQIDVIVFQRGFESLPDQRSVELRRGLQQTEQFVTRSRQWLASQPQFTRPGQGFRSLTGVVAGNGCVTLQCLIVTGAVMGQKRRPLPFLP
ncbi:MAG: hypothetical protein CTY11_06380 [Methylomonas sp.]|nr:MAG: hypothetical protein CTY11_06380 [Methylomonas sp.]